ncbi:protein ZNRD2 [Engraulis encrasicolus]|uniref:protein ZNRD2 n=1 Tax=Engraulis encrasicolus TaxID=184585 RepID=UPI002FD25E4E
MALNGDDEFEWEPPTEAEMKVLEAQRERQNKISKLMGDYLLKGYKMLGDCCQHCSTILLEDRQKNIYCVACQELDSDLDKDNPALNAQAALSQVRERQLASQSSSSPHQSNGNETPPPGPPSSSSRPIRTLPRPEHCEGAASGLLRAPAGAPTPPWPANPVTPTPSNAAPRPGNVNATPLDPTTAAASSLAAAISSSSPPGAAGSGTGIGAGTSAGLRVPGHHSGPIVMSGAVQQTVLEAEQAVVGKMQWAVCQMSHSAPSIESSTQLCVLIQTCANTLRTLRDLHRD